ncbi:MAG TPA: class I SAM-dependent methyltransferase [Usitatibacter sp.]|jgi:SAM-dependent methyltransferase|nr:class I SAM-dependent methyltransferase [Usitatibacter sp.]
MGVIGSGRKPGATLAPGIPPDEDDRHMGAKLRAFWSLPATNPAVGLAATAFSILVLELAMIRWLGTQIRVAAYFANLVLLATFLGMGLGVGLGRRHPGLARWALPALAAVSLVIGAAAPLGLTHLAFPDPALSIWGDHMDKDMYSGVLFQFVRSALVVTATFWALAGVFLLIGSMLGRYFDQLPPLKAYGADLGGSLAGVIVMAVLAALWTPPPVWIAVGVLPILWIVRTRWSAVAALIAIAAASFSIAGATFSPYNRIDLTAYQGFPGLGPVSRGTTEWNLSANRDYHQRMLDLRPGEGDSPQRKFTRGVYELPFSLTPRANASALVVGAGTGNDVAAALRRGFGRVVSIDIDPAILRAGVQKHPERPYADPRVVRVNDDARAYFGRRTNDEKFDVVCYGLLDSHAMFSSMSSLRLDNFVYTEEGIAEAWSRVKDDGILSLSFSVAAGPWMWARLAQLVAKSTGQEPIIVDHGYDAGSTFIAGRKLTLEQVQAVIPRAHHADSDLSWVQTPTDDWPFLYLRPNAIAWTYVTVFALVALTAGFAVRRVFGASVFSRGRFDGQMFLLGAGFLLLETRAVTQLSLLFGSTWIVNTSVFGGVLAMVLAANAVAGRLKRYSRTLWYTMLVISLIVVWALPWRVLFDLDLVLRGIAAGLIVAAPIFFAGIIFSSELRMRPDPAASLGSNLCGALMGGLLENMSMVLGLKAIVLIALVIYLGSLQAGVRREVRAAEAPA